MTQPGAQASGAAAGARRYIVIEGLIGVGKTSLCRILRDEWGARLVLEPAEDNPFLAAFYSDAERFAFPAQMFYLATRYDQQLRLAQGELFSDLVIADYHFAKDRLFAEQTLSGDELALYDRFADLLRDRVPKPDLVIFMDAPTEVIRARIERRAIDAEQVIKAAYLDSLRARYMGLWDRYRDAPVYVIDTSTINYVDDPADRQRMLAMIRGWLDGRPVPGSPEPHRPQDLRQLGLFG
ncbi:MAG: deoxynucleoside kinase [Alphaproteobacteria bacterium]|nr:deoxynucleoside kinase [Alphaproteobacteria bacterium]